MSRLREGVILANDRAESQPMAGGDFDLERFITAQATVFDTAFTELTEGRKRTHWMWFIFPQLRGLGHSPTAQFYGIGSLAEAQAYHAHPVLGARLDLCARTVLESRARALREIFGSPDDLKFASCMTLFEVAVPDVQLFGQVIDRWCAGKRDSRTLELLRMQHSAGT
jgi:uncharacterized protein (DUF1810 family)